MKLYWKAAGALFVVLLAAGTIAAYETTDTAEIGFRGVAMQVTESEERLAEKAQANNVPAALPAPDTSGPLAAEEYENVQVLGHLSTGEFTRLMTAITTWVAPNQGCAYCHNANNLASDELYTKLVSRRMIQMTMHLNENWQGKHVKQAGVTCYTCHRGQPVPQYYWYEAPEKETAYRAAGFVAHQNAPTTRAGLSSLPNNAFSTYLDGDKNIRVQSDDALPGKANNRSSIKQTEWTYSLMMHFSNSLGVNCTYCHNSRSWADWSQSPAVRGTAWHGIRMVRDLNNEYLGPLAEVFPQGRLGPLGDAPKVNCMTCHQGAYKPLLGQNMVDAYPSLKAAQPQPVVEETSDASDAGARDGSPAADGGVPMGTGSDAGSSAAATDASP